MQTSNDRWSRARIAALYHSPILDLIYEAAAVHRKHHTPNEIQVCTLLSIKTGGCPENCSYCPQSAHYETPIANHALLPLSDVVASARVAKQNGSTRFCMGAAWRQVRDDSDFERVLEMVQAVNAEGLEVCATLGMLTQEQAERLETAGLYAYNHNIDTSPEFYPEIITTRKFDDRLNTLDAIRKTSITVCCGGIIGMGETDEDRIGMIHTLANLPKYPESVPINALVPVPGTPLAAQPRVSVWDMVRMIAIARITMPAAKVRLSAGRTEMSFSDQALCFMAGANSIFAGEKLLTTPNPAYDTDRQLFETLGLKAVSAVSRHCSQSLHPPDPLESLLENRLTQRRQSGSLRKLARSSQRFDFTSNDYLGLARSNELARLIKNSFETGDFSSKRNGSTGSRLLSGNSLMAELLEVKIADFHETQSALLFNSGYNANLGTLAALLTDGDVVFYDELCHASIHDGIRLAKASAHSFKHNDSSDLEEQLVRMDEPKTVRNGSTTAPAKWIVVESLYSMNGDQAPLQQLVTLAKRFHAHLFVDEAHATGIYGSGGAGIVQELRLAADVAVRVHTFGKALGCHGAAVVGTRALRDYLINFARPLLYSTALDPHSLAAIDAAYELLPELDQVRVELKSRVKLFRSLAQAHQWKGLLESESHIQAIIIPGNASVREVARKVQSGGFDVRPILSPTVPQGQERLRICLHSYNTEEEIRGLVQALKEALDDVKQ